MTVTVVSTIIVVITHVSIVVVGMSNGYTANVMRMIVGLVTEISVVAVEACTVSICIHVGVFATAYTVIYLWSIAASIARMVAIVIISSMGVVDSTVLSCVMIIAYTESPVV